MEKPNILDAVVPKRCPSLYAICEHTTLNVLMLEDDDFSLQASNHWPHCVTQIYNIRTWQAWAW